MQIEDLDGAIEAGAERVFDSLSVSNPGSWVMIDFPRGSFPIRDQILEKFLARLHELGPDLSLEASFQSSQPVTIAVRVV